MSWRTINISKKSYLSLKDSQLLIKQEEGEFSVPLEDVNVLMIENKQVVLSAALFDALGKHKVATFICDDKHMPSGVLLPFHQHSRQSKVIAAQLSMSEPFKKRLWQLIIKQKIKNQQTVFEKVTGVKEPKFDQYYNSVNSGDTLNREATAARLYFSVLLANTRKSPDVQNGALNYGYSIVRAALARSIVAYGFLPSIGLKHKNELNNFALVDDIFEPYRPFIDQIVFEKIDKEFVNETELTKEMKETLMHSLTSKVSLEGGEYDLSFALELTAQSLVTAIRENNVTKLVLPEIK